ncbi:hypothetical protein HJ590_08000 [Naumannella sp. ID2617S]|nr:hypothetical protein [Naumannella sp. ID2617S]
MHPASTGTVSRAPTGARVAAVDVTRYLALLGIMANHIWGTGMVARALWDLHAIAFTWLIGVGSAYAVPARGRPGRGRAVAGVALRALVLAAAGWTLEDLQAGTVSVVLVRLALITALVGVVALLPDRWLLVLVGLLWVGSTTLGWLLMAYLPGAFHAGTGWRSLLHPGTWPYQLFHPYYPVLPWLGVALLGLWVARRLRFDRPRDLVRLGVGGAVLAGAGLLVSLALIAWFGHPEPYSLAFRSFGEFPMLAADWRWLLGVGPYLPSAPSLAVSSGVVMLLTALISAVCRLLGDHNPAVRVMAIVGAMTFTAYFAHVLLTRAARAGVQAHLLPGSPLLHWLVQVVLLTAALWAWHRWIPGRLGKGPLEWLSRAFAAAVLDRVAPQKRS